MEKIWIYIVTWCIMGISYSGTDEFGRNVCGFSTEMYDCGKEKKFIERDSAMAFYARAKREESNVFSDGKLWGVKIDSAYLEVEIVVDSVYPGCCDIIDGND